MKNGWAKQCVNVLQGWRRSCWQIKKKKQGKEKHVSGGGKHKRVGFIYITAVSAIRELANTLLQFSY